MKLCFSTLGCTELSLDGVIDLAKKYSVTGVEFRGLCGVMNNCDIEEFSEASASETKRKLASAGILPLGLGTSASFHAPERYDVCMKEAKAAVIIASRVGISNVRVFGDRIETERETVIARVIKGLSELCDFALDKGVGVLFEVHGHFNTVETVLPVAEAFSHYSNFGIIWDIEHTHKTYGAEWRKFYVKLRPYIKHVHIKDFSDAKGALCMIGEGDVPIKDVLARLLNDGYGGFVSLEWEKKWHPELADVEEALARFCKIALSVG